MIPLYLPNLQTDNCILKNKHNKINLNFGCQFTALSWMTHLSLGGLNLWTFSYPSSHYGPQISYSWIFTAVCLLPGWEVGVSFKYGHPKRGTLYIFYLPLGSEMQRRLLPKISLAKDCTTNIQNTMNLFIKATWQPSRPHYRKQISLL